MRNACITQHKLDFLAAPWPRNREWMLFKIGTCEGQWRSVNDAYEILSIINSIPGNGHLNDVFEWFEFSCKRDGKKLRILQLWNDKFKKHLLYKRGFIDIGNSNLEKTF